jgi:hypothetical protein
VQADGRTISLIALDGSGGMTDEQHLSWAA